MTKQLYTVVGAFKSDFNGDFVNQTVTVKKVIVAQFLVDGFSSHHGTLDYMNCQIALIAVRKNYCNWVLPS